MKKNPISFEEIQKICVRMPNWVGDVVMATPFLKNLRKAFPHQKIDLIMRAHLIPILEDFSYVDEIFPIYDKGWRGPFQSAQKLRHHKYDLAFILPHSFRCALTFKLASIPIRIGFGGALHSIFYHYKGKIYSYEREGKLRPIPMDLYYFRLLESLGIEPKDRTLELPLDQDRKDFSRQYLESLGIQSSKPLVALNPGAAFGSSKLWPPDYFSRLGDMIVQELDAQILILCGPGEEELARKIHQNMKAKDACFSTHHQIIPLRYLGAVLRHCQLMISTDSGPRHFATAFQVPLIVLAGPIHPGYTQLAQESLVFVKEDTPCAPCHKKVCPIDHPCMTRLLPEKVMVSVRSLWEKYVAGTFQGLFE